MMKEFRNISKANREILLNMLNKEHELVGIKVDDPCYEIKRDYLPIWWTIRATRNYSSY